MGGGGWDGSGMATILITFLGLISLATAYIISCPPPAELPPWKPARRKMSWER